MISAQKIENLYFSMNVSGVTVQWLRTSLKNDKFHTAEDLLNIEASKEDINQKNTIYESESETSECTENSENS